MRITEARLRKIIQEEIAKTQPRSAESDTIQVDHNGKPITAGAEVYGGLSVRLVASILSSDDVKALRKMHALELDESDFYLSFENTYERPVKVYMKDGDRSLEGTIKPGPRSGFMPITTNKDGGPSDTVVLGVSTWDNDRFWNDEPASINLGKMIGYDAMKLLKAGTADGEQFNAVLIKLVIGPGQDPTADAKQASYPMYKDWVAEVKESPLKEGSSGKNVRIAQGLLIDALRVIGSRPLDLPDQMDTRLKSVLKKSESEFDMAKLVNELADAIQKSGPDGKFGPMTKLATEIVQHTVTNSAGADQPQLKQDGIIGEQTGIVLVNGLHKGREAPIKGRLQETILRWNKLAGLLKN